MGSTPELLQAAFAPVRRAIADGRIPGAVLGVWACGATGVLAEGMARTGAEGAPMRGETWFDLASLTKVVFTTSEILRLVRLGRIGLDDPLTVAIPDLRQYDVAGAAERRLSFRQCLAHQTHLPAVAPLYTYGQDPATLRAFVLQRAWASGPAVYSDINFILLGIAIERLTGGGLDRRPLPEGLSFRPEPALCAATEFCQWRGRVMQGEVHDENAFALGGAAGHAGLFGQAAALLAFSRALLEGGDALGLDASVLRQRQSATRGLGWEMAHPGWSGGAACSAGTIGHTGFTGTGLWVDFERDLAWTLLTNRVHPSRHVESGIASLRQEVGRIVCGG